MMKGLRRVVVVVVLGVGLAGCAPGGEVTPSPTVGESTAVVVMPTPSPTPRWDEEEQGAADAVQRYLEVWTSIAQSLATADLNQIRDVAGDPLANDNLTTLANWQASGWHLVGGPSFRADSVEHGVRDYQGLTLRVDGCYLINGSYLVDVAGDPAAAIPTEPFVATYSVLHLVSGRYMVIDAVRGDETC
jgi:hypothetical protein